MKITIKDNGYTAEKLQANISKFNTEVEKLFPNSEIQHFYYGDNCDMVTIVLADFNYADFAIYKNSIHLNGYELSAETLNKCEQLTVNDPCYKH